MERTGRASLGKTVEIDTQLPTFVTHRWGQHLKRRPPMATRMVDIYRRVVDV